jgi:pimeloyl-ACP methyl ester carboxylesterase
MRTTFVIVVLAFVGLLMFGCGREAPLSPKVTTNSAPSVLSAGRSIPSQHAALAQHVEGKVGPGSRYAMDVPADWNGDLVLYAHGYTNPAAPVALPNITALRDLLLAQGFAVAYSSFSGNGYVVKDGAQRTAQLAGLFTSKFSPPRRIFLIGSSLGGIIALKLAESHPAHYAGCLTACGVVGGTRAELDYIGTVRVLFDYFGSSPESVTTQVVDLQGHARSR